MDIFSIFTLCGGLAFFLYGMIVMSTGLEKIAGGKMEKMLEKMTSNPIKSLVLGAGITKLFCRYSNACRFCKFWDNEIISSYWGHYGF
jgi:hypothetical protein